MANNSGFPLNRNPETTNWEEHGAAGDVSTGRRLKYVQDVPLKTIIDEASDTVTYIGEAVPSATPSQPLWRIIKADSTTNPTTIFFADADDNFDNIWVNRASLSYS